MLLGFLYRLSCPTFVRLELQSNSILCSDGKAEIISQFFFFFFFLPSAQCYHSNGKSLLKNTISATNMCSPKTTSAPICGLRSLRNFIQGLSGRKGRKKEKHSSSHGLLSKRERNKDSRNTEHCRSQKKVVEREEEQRKKTLLFCVFLRISSIRRFTRCHPHYESVTSVPITHRRSRPGRRMLDACCACCEGLRLQLNEPCACSCARQPFLRA